MPELDADNQSKPLRILVLGATGTIGRAAVRALLRRGFEVKCLVRPGAPVAIDAVDLYRFGDVTNVQSIKDDGFCGEHFDVLLSCLASRNGTHDDAWAIDYQAHIDALGVAKAAGVPHFILLSAICVQKPQLPFQHAKLAFEKALVESGLRYSIVRPTAYFKSLSGQVRRVQNGKPFLLFGDGLRTACKPISDDDLAEFLADCVQREDRYNAILPVGGPGDAMTPLAQGQMLFELLGMKPRFKHVPVALLDIIIRLLKFVGHLVPAANRKAQLAQIGRYYATESMLVWDAQQGRYDPDATPSTGHESLRDYYRQLIMGKSEVERGDHSVF